MQAVVTAGDQQEDRNNRVNRRTVKVADAGVMRGEAANSDGRKAVTDGVKRRHPGKPQRQRAGDGQQNVDEPQRFCRFGNSRAHFVILQRPGHLRPVQLHPTDAEYRQDRDRQHNDPHPAKPLQHLAIEKDGMRQRVEANQRGCARGGEAREGFKKRIGYRQVWLLGEDKG